MTTRKQVLVAVVATAMAIEGAMAGTSGFNTTVSGTNVTVQVGLPSITPSVGNSGAYAEGTGDWDFKIFGPGCPRTIDNGATVTLSFDARFTNTPQPFNMGIAFMDAAGEKPWVQLKWFDGGDPANAGQWHHYAVPFVVPPARGGAGADEFATWDWMLLSMHQPGVTFNFDVDNYSLTSIEGEHFTSAMNVAFDNGVYNGKGQAGLPVSGYGANNGQSFVVVGVPEPATLTLLAGVLSLAFLRRR